MHGYSVEVPVIVFTKTADAGSWREDDANARSAGRQWRAPARTRCLRENVKIQTASTRSKTVRACDEESVRGVRKSRRASETMARRTNDFAAIHIDLHMK